MRATYRQLALACLVVPGLALGACGGSPSASAGLPHDLRGKTGAQIVAASLAAAAHAAWFHIDDTSTDTSQTQRLTGDLGSGAAQLSVQASGASLDVATVGGMGYIRGSAASLQSALGLPAAVAAAHSGQWISLRPQDPPYVGFASILSGSILLREFAPGGTVKVVGTRRVDGQDVIELSGGLPGNSAAGQSGTIILDVAARAPHLPVASHGTAAGNGQRAKEQVSFSAWGKEVTVTAPSGAVAYSSLAPG